MLNKEEIKEIIPQRDPFLMIDEIEEYILYVDNNRLWEVEGTKLRRGESSLSV